MHIDRAQGKDSGNVTIKHKAPVKKKVYECQKSALGMIRVKFAPLLFYLFYIFANPCSF